MKILLLICFIFTFTTINAQTESPDLVTDRPDRTESALVVPKGSLQIESGIEFQNDKTTDGVEINSLSIASTLFRYGLFKDFEMRLAASFLSEEIKSAAGTISDNGLADLMLGFKYEFVREHESVPDIGLMVHFLLPAGSEAFKPAKVEPQAILSIARDLCEVVSLGTNLGAQYNSAVEEMFYFYTLAAGFGLADKLGMFVELYSEVFPAAAPFVSAGAGFTYLVMPNLQLDLSGGNGLFNNSKVWYIGAGISARIPR